MYVVKNLRYFAMKVKEPKQYWIVIPLILVNHAQNKDQLLNKLWEHFMEDDPELR